MTTSIIVPPIVADEQQNRFNWELSSLLSAGLIGGTAANSLVNANNSLGPTDSSATMTNTWWLYRYLAVKFADSSSGSNLRDTWANATYVALRNSDVTTESTNPADYTYFQYTNFSTTFNLYYNVVGGRRVQLMQASSPPGSAWQAVPQTGLPIDLDIVTASATPAYTLNITVRNTATTSTDPATWAYDPDGIFFRNNLGTTKYLVVTVSIGGVEQTFAAHNTYSYSWSRNGTSFTPATSGATTTARFLPITPADVQDAGQDQFVCTVTTP